MFLVAPLPYLLMLGLGRYIKALAYREEVDRYRAELLDFKGFEVALFISIIAAAVVGRALQDSTGSAPAAGSEAGSDTHSLSWQFALAAAILIATLAGYFLIIELRAAAAQRLNAEREKMRHEQEMAIIHAREGISDEP
ncbi:MAG: hypothetical protein JNK58_06675 [Phycisphaerae bacterium]|nr:hypothetical protein [Phycisphaerae bacterium]